MGLGNIAHKFATDLLTVEYAELHAVASRSQEKANTFAAKFGATKAYACYEDFILDEELDAVYIATPHALHKSNTMLCLKHKVAVLCEKPFAMNTSEVNDMINMAKEKNVLLMEALWTYFLPHYQYVLQAIETKKYGNLIGLEADFGFYRAFNNDSRLFNKGLGGGSLLDIGIYPIFVALSTLGIPEHIEAKATYFENGADASCDMVFSYQNQVKAILKSSLLEDTTNHAVFKFDQGSIRINSGFHAPTTISIFPKTGPEENLDFGYNTIGYNYEIIHFNDLLRKAQTESPIMSFDFSKQLITLLDIVRQHINLTY